MGDEEEELLVQDDSQFTLIVNNQDEHYACTFGLTKYTAIIVEQAYWPVGTL